MDSHHLRAILLKLQDRLSDDDRKRLHFYLGKDVPRRIRDDPSLGGTLCLLESLFDQDKINEQDFTFIINAFDEIQCLDAVKLLRGHMKRIQASEVNQSIQSLSLLMPSLADQVLQDQDDKYSVNNHLMEQTNISRNNDTIITNKNIPNHSMTVVVSNPKKSSLSLKQKQLFSVSSMAQKFFLSFVLLSIILFGVVIGCSVWIGHLRTERSILHEHTKNNETMHYMRQSQTRLREVLEDLMQKMRDVMVKRLRQLEKNCLGNPNSISQTTTASVLDNQRPTYLEDLACLEACYYCVKDYPIIKPGDNCGPMCDCADSCSRMPIEQINKTYGQSDFTSDKGCFWSTYTKSFKDNDIFLLP